MFRLKDNALFPVLRGEQCTHENRITRIKLQISARLDGKKCGSSSSRISRLPHAPYFSFCSIPALLITDSTRETTVHSQRTGERGRARALGPATIAEICSRRGAAKLSFTNLQFIIAPDAIGMKRMNK